MNPAHRLVPAVAAGHVGRLAGAGNRRERAVEHPDDLAEIDGAWVAGEQIAAALPFPAAQDALIPKLEQDQLEELRRDLLLPGKVGDPHRCLRTVLSQGNQGLEGVLGLPGYHGCSPRKKWVGPAAPTGPPHSHVTVPPQ